MEAKVRLYPLVKVQGQTFKTVKRVTVPAQSMSLREILRRFVRRESLPVAHEGVYEDRFEDLEKLKNVDITEQMERVDQLKTQLALFEQRYNEHQAKIAAQKAAAANPQPLHPQPSPGEGAEPIKSPPLKGA